MIGTLDDVVFIASNETLRTFDEFTRSSSARWAKHDVLGSKPRSQFIGPDLDEIAFSMRFDVHYGVKPKEEMDRLLTINREGKAVNLTIGGNSLGVGLWVIESIEQSWDVIDNAGNVLVGTAKVKLIEYIEGDG